MLHLTETKIGGFMQAARVLNRDHRLRLHEFNGKTYPQWEYDPSRDPSYWKRMIIETPQMPGRDKPIDEVIRELQALIRECRIGIHLSRPLTRKRRMLRVGGMKFVKGL